MWKKAEREPEMAAVEAEEGLPARACGPSRR